MEIGNHYYNQLCQNPNIQILPPSNAFSKNIYWVVGIVIKKSKMTASILSKKLDKHGIKTRLFFSQCMSNIFLKK